MKLDRRDIVVGLVGAGVYFGVYCLVASHLNGK